MGLFQVDGGRLVIQPTHFMRNKLFSFILGFALAGLVFSQTKAAQFAAPFIAGAAANITQPLAINWDALNKNIADADKTVKDLNLGNLDAKVKGILDSIDLNALAAPSGFVRYLADFKKRVFYESPSYEIGQSTWSVGFSGDDVLNFGAEFAQCGIDWFLYKKLQQEAITTSLEKLLHNRAELIPKLKNVTYSKAGWIEASKMESNEHSKALFDHLNAQFTMPLKIQAFITKPAFLKMVAYTCVREAFALAKEAVIRPDGSPFAFSMNDLFTPPQQEDVNKPWSSYYLFKQVTGIFAVGARSRYTVTALANTIFKYTGCRSSYADTYVAQAIKRLVISVWFMKQLNTLYKDQMITYITTNAPQLHDLLDAYEISSKKEPSKDKDQELSQAHGKLQKFVETAHKKSFLIWLRFKVAAFARADFFMEALYSWRGWYNVAYYAFQGLRLLTGI